MSGSSPFAVLLEEFAALLGQAALPIDERGVCTFLVDGNLPMNLALRGDGLLTAFVPLGRVPETGQHEWWARMLHANGAGASPYVFGLIPGTQSAVVSCHRALAGLDASGLAQWLGDLAAVASGWMQGLAVQPGPGSKADGPDAAPSASWLQV